MNNKYEKSIVNHSSQIYFAFIFNGYDNFPYYMHYLLKREMPQN